MDRLSVDDAQARLGRHFDLPPQISKLLTLLLVMEFVSIEAIATRIGPSNPRMLIHQLRRRLLLNGLKIEIHNTRGHGYFMKDDIKAAFLGLPLFSAVNPALDVIKEDNGWLAT